LPPGGARQASIYSGIAGRSLAPTVLSANRNLALTLLSPERLSLPGRFNCAQGGAARDRRARPAILKFCDVKKSHPLVRSPVRDFAGRRGIIADLPFAKGAGRRRLIHVVALGVEPGRLGHGSADNENADNEIKLPRQKEASSWHTPYGPAVHRAVHWAAMDGSTTASLITRHAQAGSCPVTIGTCVIPGHFRSWANSRFRRTHPTIHQSGIPGLTETIPYSPPRRRDSKFESRTAMLSAAQNSTRGSIGSAT